MANQNFKQNFLGHCLIEALDDANFEFVQRILVEHNADPNAIIYNQEIAPIHYAVGCENVEVAEKVVQFMLEHCDANPNVQCQEKVTPLHIATMNGRGNILKMLLAYGGDTHAIDVYGKTPVHYAIQELHFDCVKIIQNYQFELNIEKKKHLVSIILEEPTPTKHPSRVEILRNLEGNDDYLSVTQLEQSKYTPNHKNYNFNISSPYYINLENDSPRRCSVVQRKIALEESPRETDKENIGPACRTNLFELTEENLCEFSKNMYSTEERGGRRASFIKTWRDKIKTMRRYSVLKRNMNALENIISNFDTTANDELGNGEGDKTVDLETTEYFSAVTPTTPLRLLNNGNNLGDERTPPTTQPAEIVRFSGSKGIEYNFDRTSPFYVNITHRPRRNSSKASQEEEMVIEEPNANPIIIVTSAAAKTSPELPEETIQMKSPKQVENIIIQTEGYVHSDTKNEIVFFEKKIHLNPVVSAAKKPGSVELNQTESSLSTAYTVPLDYESDLLRQELTNFGEPPGPITKTTKKIYIKKLIKYKRNPNYSADAADKKMQTFKPSIFDDLQNTFQNPKWVDHLQVYFQYEQQMIKEFKESAANIKREFREGHLKKSFIYLLIDPQIADNLPLQHQFLDFQQVWQRFISSIFYVGKGTAERPYSHLYDAMKLFSRSVEKEEVRVSLEENMFTTPLASNTKMLEKVSESIELNEKNQLFQLTASTKKKKLVSCNLFGSPVHQNPPKLSPKIPKKLQADSEKLKKILNIWRQGNGVVCLHIFHNLMPVEAYTREAAIIDCLSLQRVTNLKRGDYYGIAKLWNMKMKKKLGLAFLYRALNIYLHEGETQIMPNDLI